MSRIDRVDVWNNFFRFTDQNQNQLCPVCNLKQMRLISNDWERGHILGIAAGGPDVYPNVIPMCVDCNQSSRGCRDTFEYLTKIGKLTVQESTQLRDKLKQQIADFDPICTSYLLEKCSNKKRNQYELYCNRCNTRYEKENIIPMDCL